MVDGGHWETFILHLINEYFQEFKTAMRNLSLFSGSPIASLECIACLIVCHGRKQGMGARSVLTTYKLGPQVYVYNIHSIWYQ